jgi:probable poly-beta-1,6-N-acetyl-D-glucosamine export protein
VRNSSGWLQGIQYFRAIAIIEVIVLHVTRYGAATVPDPQWIVITLIAFTSFAVPHFIFISGVVLYNKYKKGFSLSTFYKKRFSSVLPPYLVWSTFYFASLYAIPTIYAYLFHHPTGHGSNQTIASLSWYLQELAVGFGHLWFVVVILQLYLLYPLLVKIYNRHARQNSPIYVLLLLLLVQIGYGLLLTKGDLNPLIAASVGNLISVAFPIQLIISYSAFLFYAFYFVLGFFVAEHYEAIKQLIAKISLTSISLAVLVSTIYYAVVCYHIGVLLTPPSSFYIWLYLLTGPFYCLTLIIFYLKLSTSWGEPRGFLLRYLERIGEDSFGIYLVHYFFVGQFAGALELLGLSANNLLFYPVLFLLTLISSYLSVEAIYRLPLSYIIIGKPRKEESKPPQMEQISSAQ